MTNPYTDQSLVQHGTDIKYTVRTFSAEVDENELVWHRDKESRTSLTLRKRINSNQECECLDG